MVEKLETEKIVIIIPNVCVELKEDVLEFISHKDKKETYYSFPIMNKQNENLTKLVQDYGYLITEYKIKGSGKLIINILYNRANLSLLGLLI